MRPAWQGGLAATISGFLAAEAIAGHLYINHLEHISDFSRPDFPAAFDPDRQVLLLNRGGEKAVEIPMNKFTFWSNAGSNRWIDKSVHQQISFRLAPKAECNELEKTRKEDRRYAPAPMKAKADTCGVWTHEAPQENAVVVEMREEHDFLVPGLRGGRRIYTIRTDKHELTLFTGHAKPLAAFPAPMFGFEPGYAFSVSLETRFLSGSREVFFNAPSGGEGYHGFIDILLRLRQAPR